MSKPNTRQGLIDYCLRRLGAPVLEINVDDDQIDDLVDDAIQHFQDYHFDGIQRVYLKHEITKEEKEILKSGITTTTANSNVGISTVNWDEGQKTSYNFPIMFLEWKKSLRWIIVPSLVDYLI